MATDNGLLRRFNKKYTQAEPEECWIWNASVDGKGYGQINAGCRGAKMLRAHRVSYEVFIGEIPHGLCVLHKCDTPRCVNPSHLFLGTQKDNVKDCWDKGRRTNNTIGEKHWKCKLSDNDIIEIRSLLNDGLKQVQIAERFNMSQAHVSKISRMEAMVHATRT